MKESYGGTFMLWLFLFFFVIYITILCVALQFAKTYRVKNKIVNLVEQYKYNIYADSQDEDFNEKLDKYLERVPYSSSVDMSERCKAKVEDNTDSEGKAVYYTRGVCISTNTVESKSSDSGIYYEVEVYFVVQLPFLLEKGITIPIKGETTRILIN